MPCDSKVRINLDSLDLQAADNRPQALGTALHVSTEDVLLPCPGIAKDSEVCQSLPVRCLYSHYKSQVRGQVGAQQ